MCEGVKRSGRGIPLINKYTILETPIIIDNLSILIFIIYNVLYF